VQIFWATLYIKCPSTFTFKLPTATAAAAAADAAVSKTVSTNRGDSDVCYNVITGWVDITVNETIQSRFTNVYIHQHLVLQYTGPHTDSLYTESSD